VRQKLLLSAIAVATTAVLGLAGCGGDETEGPVCFDYAGFDGTMPATSFSADVLPAFRTSCGISGTCHGNPSGLPGQPYLGPKNGDPAPTPTEITSIIGGLGATSTKEPSMRLVVASKPEESFLMHKADGMTRCDSLPCAAGGTCGTPMPPAGVIDAASRDKIRLWIAQGALDN
jgi:hypothetical protein